ncbi:MAG: hypothetical protein JWR27_280, partial [Aeromicrobium sp.]|nr:hypothetical protein [Aeromicrobium sp.]
RGHLVDHDLGSKDGAAHMVHGLRELRGRAIDLASDSHPAMVGAMGSGLGLDTPHDLRDWSGDRDLD